MKISILAPDMSSNCLGRAHLLAMILKRSYDVEIVGPILGKGIWRPLATDTRVDLVPLRVGMPPFSYWQLMRLPSMATGDVIYASKPLLTSFGSGLTMKYFKKKALVLDIDDWEMGFVKDRFGKRGFPGEIKHMVASALMPYRPNSDLNILLSEKLVGLADRITVSNLFLEKKYGGTVVYHARERASYDPERYDKDDCRKLHSVEEDRKVVMFFGTQDPYKGLEDLIDAVNAIGDPDILLVVVGIDGNKAYSVSLSNRAREQLGPRYRGFGMQPFDKVPEFVAMADLVVIPQRRRDATVGQLPAKVFDAMAMGKPVVATRVSDLPLILEGCGLVVEPGNVGELSRAIEQVLGNPGEARDTGGRAREKFLREYSWESVSSRLIGVFSDLG